MIEVTTPALAGHPFLRGMPSGQLDALAAAASDVTFPAGHRIFEESELAGKFWLIRSGRVSLDMHVPENGRVIIDTVGTGSCSAALGCSRRTGGRAARFASRRCGRSSSMPPPSARCTRRTRCSAMSSLGGSCV
jgi:CRP-like cAMP-binding protein